MYKAEMFGPSWKQGPTAELKTIRECREWAESYGTTADKCSIRNAKGRLIGVHRRDRNGNGMRWFRVKV